MDIRFIFIVIALAVYVGISLALVLVPCYLKNYFRKRGKNYKLLNGVFGVCVLLECLWLFVPMIISLAL